ncbi:DsbA family oxidoreductase [Shewanella frigidimarina]|uniref:DsbA family oxidoreductase n=1 Tax=Shewanella frigidimarina TaxID=56812 RepID=UPI003D7B1A48
MTAKIKLDIISDVVCPWCIVGYKHLEAAINELGLQDQVEIEWQPFELNPNMPAEGENLREHSARKYGTTPEGSVRARANIAQQGAEHGFIFDYFEQMKMVNTLDAHVLLEYANEVGKQTELKLRLFSAFFTEHKDISNREVLTSELTAVGINAAEAMSLLDNAAVAEQVRAKEAHWQQLGISGVPTVIFNQSSALTGAHPVEAYKQVLAELVAQR